MDVQRLPGALGAEIRGVDLRSVTEADVERILDVLHEHEVVFFPGAHLTGDEHLALAQAIGEVDIFPFARMMGATEPTFQVITDGPDSPSQADGWHTDVTWVAEPPRYALLHAEVIPERGGDTVWASMTAAHDALSPTMQELLAGLEVVHDNTSFIGGVRAKMGDAPEVDALCAQLQETYPPVTHPLVRTHPATGRRALFLGGGFMRGIVGMTDAESDALLGMLARHIDDVRFHCRWSWTPGDLAIWDERSTNHRAVGNPLSGERAIRRIEIAGDRPYFDPGA